MPRITTVTDTDRDGVRRVKRTSAIERLREAEDLLLELRAANLEPGSARHRFLVANHHRSSVDDWSRMLRVDRRVIVKLLRREGIIKPGVTLREDRP